MPGPDEEPLAVPGRLLRRALAQAPVIADAPIQKDVVPPGDMERRNAHLRVAALDAPPLPVLVARGMLEPVEEPGSDPLPAEQRVLLDGQRAEPQPGRAERREELRLQRVQLAATGGVLRKVNAPGLGECEVERAPTVGPAVVVLRRGHSG